MAAGAGRGRLQRNDNFFRQGGERTNDAEGKVRRAFQRCAENGVLNLSGQNLIGDLPATVCGFQEASWAERWWEQCPIQKIDVSHNALERIPSDIGRLSDCAVFLAFSNALSSVPPELFTDLPLKQLNLRQNRLATLPAAALAHSAALVELVLTENQLAELAPEVVGLPALEILELGANRLTALPAGPWGCLRLRRLDVTGNKIGPELPSALRECQVLRELCAASNLLEDVGELFVVGPGHGWRSSLVSLDLSNNRIGPTLQAAGLLTLDSLNVASNRISQLDLFGQEGFPRLSTLIAEGNQIAEFPRALLPSSAPMLCTLDLLNNNLTALPPELGLATALKRIALVGNPLRSIRPELVRGSAEALKKFLLTRLEGVEVQEAAELAADSLSIELRAAAASRELALEGRGLAALPALPEGLVTLRVHSNSLTSDALLTALGLLQQQSAAVSSDLRVLSASQNELGNGAAADYLLPALICELPALRELDLSACGISSCGGSGAWGFAHAPSALTRADLSRNALQQLPADMLACCPNLHELRLSGNRIGDLEGFASMCGAGLCTLDLEGNRLCSAPSWLPTALPQLRTLLLANNELGPSLPAEWGFWEALQAVSLVGNPLRGIRQALLAKGWPAVAAHLRDKLPEGAPRVAPVPPPETQRPPPAEATRSAPRGGERGAGVRRAPSPSEHLGGHGARAPQAVAEAPSPPSSSHGLLVGAGQADALDGLVASLRSVVADLEGELAAPGLSRARPSGSFGGLLR